MVSKILQHRLKWRALLLPLLCAALLLSGGGCLSEGEDSLFSLPEPAIEHLALQNKLDDITKLGYEYAPPVNGENRTAIQFADLYAGSEPAAMSFFRDPKSDTLYIYAFEIKPGKTDDDVSCSEKFVITGQGTKIDRVSFSDLDGNGVTEIAVGWRVGSDSVFNLNVYDISSGQPELILDTKYVDLCLFDLTADDSSDLLTLNASDSGAGLEAVLYSYKSKNMELLGRALLSTGITKIERIAGGYMEAGMPVAAVDSRYLETQFLTDVLWYDSEQKILKNLSLPASEQPVYFAQTRQVAVYSGDLDHDGLMEIPVSVLSNYETIDADLTVYERIDWSRYGIDGNKTQMYSSYNDIVNGWYLLLPERWRYTVFFYSGENARNMQEIVFALYDDHTPLGIPLLKIRIYTGNDHSSRKGMNEILLAEKFDMTISAEILSASGSNENYNISEDDLKYVFKTSSRVMYG